MLLSMKLVQPLMIPESCVTSSPRKSRCEAAGADGGRGGGATAGGTMRGGAEACVGARVGSHLERVNDRDPAADRGLVAEAHGRLATFVHARDQCLELRQVLRRHRGAQASGDTKGMADAGFGPTLVLRAEGAAGKRSAPAR